MITVIAGVNGAGKSSVVGSSIRSKGGVYHNPDEKAQALLSENPDLELSAANGQAWSYGFEKLTLAVSENLDYIFETTLGGNSVPEKLHEAADAGQGLRIIFCGLDTPELHMARVQARVKRGGHDIPEAKIRDRWVRSIFNMTQLIPKCQDVKVYDNSQPLVNGKPNPILLFAMKDGVFTSQPVKDMPDWARPLATAAMEVYNDPMNILSNLNTNRRT